MVSGIMIAVVSLLILYITLTVVYNYFLVCAYFFIKETKPKKRAPHNSFCIFIPAHNEELLLGRLIDSLKQLEYPVEKYEIIVIADNCNDTTEKIALDRNVTCLCRNDKLKIGKGYALSWAMEKIELSQYDAVLIIDADNYVSSDLLSELDYSLFTGSDVVQCNNSIANPDSSWFTRIHHVVRVIDNTLVHYSKYKIGLSSFLMGNGMCFRSSILERFPWRSFSLSEDYEYYTRLVLKNIFVDFNYNAKVFHQESVSLKQAQSQRSRWASGKFELIKKTSLKMLVSGIKEMNFKKIEASFILILPHPSLLFNMTIVTLLLSMFIGWMWFFLILALLFLQLFYFVIGLFVARASIKTVLSFCYAPLYLLWKAVIDINSLIGKNKPDWKRTARKEK